MSNMQAWKQNIGSLIDYAERIFPDVEIVSRVSDWRDCQIKLWASCKKSKKIRLMHLESYGIKARPKCWVIWHLTPTEIWKCIMASQAWGLSCTQLISDYILSRLPT